jgi:hypothetical protein
MGELSGVDGAVSEGQYEKATWMLGAILHAQEEMVEGERMEVEKCMSTIVFCSALFCFVSPLDLPTHASPPQWLEASSRCVRVFVESWICTRGRSIREAGAGGSMYTMHDRERGARVSKHSGLNNISIGGGDIHQRRDKGPPLMLPPGTPGERPPGPLSRAYHHVPRSYPQSVRIPSTYTHPCCQIYYLGIRIVYVISADVYNVL